MLLTTKLQFLMRSQVPCWTQVGSKLVKQQNCLELGARSLLSALKGVEGCAKAPGWDQEEGQALVTYSNMYQTNQQVGQFTFWSTFSARTSRGQPWTHKAHHGLDSGEATTFPHIVFSMSLRDTYIRMTFCLGTLKEDPKIVSVWIPGTLRVHNSLLRSPIRVRFKTNLQLSLRAFLQCVAFHLHTPRLGQFPTFSGWESNCQFDFQPFFLP